MNAERWRRIDDVLQAALSQPPSERDRLLASACAEDEPLRAEIESLLRAHDHGGLLDARVSEVAADVLRTERPPLQEGECLGPYRVLRRLGSGGMSDVYLAKDRRLGRQVALKVLDASRGRAGSRTARFTLEARAASALNHSNIATVYDAGCDDGRHYIASELVEGQTLRTRLNRPVHAADAIAIAIQIAEGLDAAHRAGIVHRDVKPENLILRPDGVVKIVDFGLAKLVGGQAGVSVAQDTVPGLVLGTTLYMSPEQAQGLDVDARSDIFSLGVVLYEMVAGRPPFGGSTVGDAIASILRDVPPSLPEHSPGVPPELDRIIRKALEKDRNRRYRNVVDFLSDLKRLAAHATALPRRRGLAAALVLTSAVTLLASVSYRTPASEPTRTEGTSAHELSVKGRFFWNKRTIAGLETSVKYFEQAIKIDPTYAPAHAGLAASYLAFTGNPSAPRPPRDYLAHARRAALEAIRIDSTNVEARVTLAAVRHTADWDWAGAERDFKAAIALDPRYASAHHRYGIFLAFMRRFDEGIAELQRAEQLDPVSVAIGTDLGMTYNFARQPDRAIVQLQKALEIDPTFARVRFNLAEAYEQKGLFAQAAAVAPDASQRGPGMYPGRIAVNRLRILAGGRSETQELLNEVLRTQEYVPPTFVAELYAMLGRHDEAFHWLYKALDDGGLLVPRLYADPRWERYPLYSDPRFAALLRRAGLPPGSQLNDPS